MPFNPPNSSPTSSPQLFVDFWHMSFHILIHASQLHNSNYVVKMMVWFEILTFHMSL